MFDKLVLRNLLSGALSVFRFQRVPIVEVQNRELEEYFIKSGDYLNNVFFSAGLDTRHDIITPTHYKRYRSNQKSINS
jgi:hypothetical protein